MIANIKSGSSPDNLFEKELINALERLPGGGSLLKKLICLQTVDSTNEYAKKLAEAGAEDGSLVTSNEQTAGKGRVGRSWKTPAGEAIAFSLILRPVIAASKISMVTLVMGLSVAKAVRNLYFLPAMIKWPNDVVVDDRKICGILTELGADNGQIRYIVIGTGINANIKSFPDELKDMATSLNLKAGHEIDRAELTAAVLGYFEQYYRLFVKSEDLSELMDEYNSILVNRGNEVKVLDPAGWYSGISEGINPSGELMVRLKDGTEKAVFSGEVSVRGLYGYV